MLINYYLFYSGIWFMKTLCIETTEDEVIWWWVRFPSGSNVIYTTLDNQPIKRIRELNLSRFGISCYWLSKGEYEWLLEDSMINIQIVSNNGSSWIKWFYANPKQHPILSKSWLSWIIHSHNLQSIIPNTVIIPKDEIVFENIHEKIGDYIVSHFNIGDRIVIKNANLDWNWSGVYFLDYDSRDNLQWKVKRAIAKFEKSIWKKKHKLISSDYIIQEQITDWIWEWSITFSIQNNSIVNRWLVNNCLMDWEYFWSTNYFSYLSSDQKKDIESNFFWKLNPLLKQLQSEWIRGNVGFDVIIRDNNWEKELVVLECNWIYRTTWSTRPNSFWYNTSNELFMWIPIAWKYLKEQFDIRDDKWQIKIYDQLIWFWTQSWKPQIMNLKCEWIDRWHPVSWIASAWNSVDEIRLLFQESWLLNSSWEVYVKRIMKSLLSL